MAVGKRDISTQYRQRSNITSKQQSGKRNDPQRGLEPRASGTAVLRSTKLSYRGCVVVLGGIEPPTSNLSHGALPSELQSYDEEKRVGAVYDGAMVSHLRTILALPNDRMHIKAGQIQLSRVEMRIGMYIDWTRDGKNRPALGSRILSMLAQARSRSAPPPSCSSICFVCSPEPDVVDMFLLYIHISFRRFELVKSNSSRCQTRVGMAML